MIESPYKTPAEFDRAIKRAARAAEGDTGERYRQALRDRFLCRVFSDPEERFILKGGSGMLARIPNARATRDADFATKRWEPSDEIVGVLQDLASADLGDYCHFVLTRREESMDENGYSRLLRLRFATYIGEEEKDPVLVDLSLDCAVTLPPERLVPANRLTVPGVVVREYIVCSVEDQLADKLCAIMEVHPGGWQSSRMKDLLDVMTCALTQSPEASALAAAITGECARRSMDVPSRFEAPRSWKAGFSSFARKAGAPAQYGTFEQAHALAAMLFDPVLKNEVRDGRWDCAGLTWR